MTTADSVHTSNPRLPFQMSSERPHLAPPAGKSLICQVVVNIEHWQFDQPMPRLILTPPQGRGHVPDIPNFSWSEYGNRCGMPRIFKVLADRGIKATCSINAGVIDAYPSLAEGVLKAGWEWMGHGIHQRSVGGDATEADNIALALGKIERFTGRRPRGWLGPGLSETFESPDLLKAAGIDYVCEWVVDDLPAWLTTKNGRLATVPYNLDLNDSVVYAVEKQSTSEMLLRFTETLKTFEREMAETGQPRVLTLPIHPHLTGVPHRINQLIQMLDILQRRTDSVFMTGAQIFDWFVAAEAA